MDALSIAVYILFFGATVFAALRRPVFGAAALIAIQPFAYYRDVAGTTITLPKVVLVAVIVALIVRRADFRSLMARAPFGMVLAIAGVIVATALSIIHAAHHGPAIRETLKWIEYALLFAAVYLSFRSDPDTAFVSRAVALTTAAVSILAIAQEIFGAPSGLWFNGQPIPRIAGPLEGPNQLAGYLGISLAVVFALALAKADRWIIVALLLSSCAEVLTFSRAGIICAAIGVVVVGALLASKERVRAPIAAMLGGSLLGVVVAAFWGSVAHSFGIFRVSSLEVTYAGGVGTRSELWHAAFTLWKHHPLFGVGAGNFELEIGQVGPKGIRTHANSLYFQSLVEQGVIGLAATLWLVFQAMATLWKARTTRNPLTIGALGATIAFVLHQTVDLLVFFPKVGGWWFVVLALGIGALMQPDSKSRTA